MLLSKTIRMEIVHCNEFSYKELAEIFRDMQYKTCRACNDAMRMMLLNAFESMEYKDFHGVYLNMKELTGKSLSMHIYDRMKGYMDICQTGNLSQTQQFVKNRFNSDKKDLLRNEVSYTNFRKDMPIILHNKSYEITKDSTNGKYYIKCSLFNREYQKENNVKRLTFTIGRMNGHQKATLNKMINGKYKQGSAHIKQNKKGKWLFGISYTFEAKEGLLDKNRIMGVDLGIVNTAVLQIWDSEEEKYDWLEWKECILDGSRIIQFRQKVEARKRSFLRSRKASGTTNQYSKGKKGRGTQVKIKPIEHLNSKISNFRDTMNHQYSKYIVDFALKHNCGIIQMEDLSDFTEKVEEKFLRNWAYYDLQSKIEYKARKHGIEVVKVDPRYTSLRCSKCGCIDKVNRDGKKKQADFKCVECGYELNADVNAARNIALPDIEKIIEEIMPLTDEEKRRKNRKKKKKKTA